ncbi:hypothetical protein J4226_04925 [Candidatus Pacearchaeota archaeon]|nr:hypothetical protein [Candidatus Pacearchaeota archaeon]
MTYRISVIGIDGAGKSTVISKTIAKLSNEYKILKTGRPIYIEEAGKRTYFYEKTTKKIDAIHQYFDNTKFKPGISFANGLNVFIQPTLESKMITYHNPDITIASRDMTICPATYLTFYHPNSKKLTQAQRLNLFNRFRRMGYPNLITYLDINPKEAVKRIDSRIEQEQLLNKATNRNKWKHLHETEDKLKEIKKHYENALEYLIKEGEKIKIIDANQSLENVIDEFAQTIIENMKSFKKINY